MVPPLSIKYGVSTITRVSPVGPVFAIPSIGPKRGIESTMRTQERTMAKRRRDLNCILVERLIAEQYFT